MKKAEVFIGQWVRFVDKRTKESYVGYVVTKGDEKAEVKLPNKKYLAEVPYVLIHNQENPTYTIEDIDAMIDIALDTKDYDWFHELIEFKDFLAAK